MAGTGFTTPDWGLGCRAVRAATTVIAPEINALAASKYKALSKLPLRSLIQPTMNGPK